MKTSGDVLVEADLPEADLAELLDAADAAIAALKPRLRVARFTWRGVAYRAKATHFRVQVASANNRRFIAYRWRD